MPSLISVKNLQKVVGNDTLYRDLNLEIESGEITTVFGPNGAGKSTLLNILAGITRPSSGGYEIKDFNHFRFSYIFQNYRESLLPWRTNFENVALPLELQGKDKQYITTKILELEKIFDFSFDWEGYPYELSGGQQQILAFMRALVTEPDLLFIDEPFSALDYENNLKLRDHLQSYYLKYHPTIVLITHNIEEAVSLSSRIIVLSRRPTCVRAIIENNLPYPRTVETLKSPTFSGLKDRVLDAFAATVL